MIIASRGEDDAWVGHLAFCWRTREKLLSLFSSSSSPPPLVVHRVSQQQHPNAQHSKHIIMAERTGSSRRVSDRLLCFIIMVIMSYVFRLDESAMQSTTTLRSFNNPVPDLTLHGRYLGCCYLCAKTSFFNFGLCAARCRRHALPQTLQKQIINK